MRHACGVSDAYGHEEPAEDDLAGMVAALEGRIEREALARAIGVTRSELDLVAIGHAPSPDAAQRLRVLYDASRRTEGRLDDPQALTESLGVLSPKGELMVPISFLPRMKKALIAFFVVDAIIFATVLVVVMATR